MGSGKKGRVKDIDKKEGEKPEKEKKEGKRAEHLRELRQIVRVVNTDLDGSKPLINAIKGIKGISHTIAKTILIAGNFDLKKKLGDLSESEIQNLEKIIKEPRKFGVPGFLLNRQRNRKTGEDLHLTGTDLDVAKKFDVQRYIDLKSYRGWRHMLGQPVRGQRTRSHFRTGGRVVGVLRKEAKAQLAAKTVTGATPAAPTTPTTSTAPQAKKEEKK